MGLFDEQTGDLVTHWKSRSAISTLVGLGTNAKIWPDAAKQGVEAPFIYFVRAPGGHINKTLTGVSGGRVTLVHVYCWGRTPSEADKLSDAVFLNTVDYRGTMGTTRIFWIFCDSPPDSGYEAIENGSDKKRYWRRHVFRIAHD